MAHDHKKLISGIQKQLKVILDHSDQAVYAYVDDHHKICNKKFAALLGYKSPKEWAQVKDSFPQAFVAGKSHRALTNAYQNAMEKGAGSSTAITWKKKSGSTVSANVILVPMVHEGHLYALHFVSKK